MKIAIMQPYFLPYLGYFQLIAASDKFVVYDNIKYTKKGWINRNRFLSNNGIEYLTLPIKKDSDYLNVDARQVSSEFDPKHFLRRLENAYRKAPFFQDTFALVSEIVTYQNSNLFEFIDHSIRKLCAYLAVSTPILRSSSISIDHNLRSEEKVIAICCELRAATYINSMGGRLLYKHSNFLDHELTLKFLHSKCRPYKQFDEAHASNLSIVDVLMFNSRLLVQEMLSNDYEIVDGFSD